MSYYRALAVDSVTITDLTDAIVSISEPENPANGTLWIDISNGEEEGILKQYIIRDGEDKGQWVTVKLNMEHLNPELSETVKYVNSQLMSMGDDGLLTYNERVEIAKLIGEITGEAPSTTSSLAAGYRDSLPTIHTLDSGSNGGSFYKYRYSARKVGINQDKDEGNPIYIGLERAYTELSDYLSSFPLKPWDITVANKEKLVELGDSADRLREVFLNYYTAALALSELTKERGVEVSKEYTDEGIDNISIGGTNLISSDKAEEGKSLDSKGNVISDVLYDVSDFIDVVGGKDYSASIFVTPQTESEFIRYAWYDKDRKFISSGGLTDTSKVLKSPDNAAYVRMAYLKDTKPKFESGNKPTDWSPNPEDVEAQIEHTQASLIVTSNAIRGIVLETIGGKEVATIDEETGEIVYVDTSKTRISQMEQKADRIETSVSDNTGAISKLEQTIDSVTSTVSDNAGAISSIRQDVLSITKTITDNTNAISRVEQTAKSLSSEISSNTAEISRVRQTANSLSSDISNNNREISRIEQKANSISATVSSNNTGSNMVSKINMSSGGIRISGNRIAIDGDTTFSGNVRISGNLITGGSITSSSINLTGGYINKGGKGAWLEGTESGLRLDDKAFQFDYSQPAFESFGRINSFPNGRGTSLKHSLEANGLTVHSGKGYFKYNTGHQSVDIGVTGEKIRLRASTEVSGTFKVTGKLSIGAGGGTKPYDDVALKLQGIERDIGGMSARITALEKKH